MSDLFVAFSSTLDEGIWLMATGIPTMESTEPREVPDHVIPDDVLYEVIDGQIVELPPMGTRQEVTAGILQIKLGYFTDTNGLGRTVMETLFDFTEQVGRKRRPDVAFVDRERWPKSKPIPESDGWEVVPNLAVEVVSPSNAWEDVLEKIHEYFHVGAERVWVITASRRQVHVFHSPTSVRILAKDDVLTDDALFPGFRLPLADLFEAAGEAPEASA
jgi:Uma2 family endonuclease